MKKQIYVFIATLVFVLASVSGAWSAATTADGSTVRDLGPVVKQGATTRNLANPPVRGITVFDDVTIPASGTTYWSDPIDISEVQFDKGTYSNLAYMQLGFAHCNTCTSSQGDLTATYQLSHDGYNWFSPGREYLNMSAVYGGGFFYGGAADGFDPGDGDNYGGIIDMGCWPNISGGAGPYVMTNTKIVSLTTTKAHYMRFKCVNPEAAISQGDLFLIVQ